MKGTVKFYNNWKGYGFIRGEDYKEAFIHRKAVPWGTDLFMGDQVQYEIETSDRGLNAINIKKL